MTNNNGGGGNFINGFFWGALIGAGAVFLLGTKRGKKLLKVVTEQGLDKLSGIEELVDEFDDEYDPTVASKQKEDFEESKPQSKPAHKEQHSNGEAKPQVQSLIEKTKSSGRRFFKGIKKKI